MESFFYFFHFLSNFIETFLKCTYNYVFVVSLSMQTKFKMVRVRLSFVNVLSHLIKLLYVKQVFCEEKLICVRSDNLWSAFCAFYEHFLQKTQKFKTCALKSQS